MYEDTKSTNHKDLNRRTDNKIVNQKDLKKRQIIKWPKEKMTKRQTMIYKTLQKIEQHEPHCSGVEPMYSMGVATPVPLVPLVVSLDTSKKNIGLFKVAVRLIYLGQFECSNISK